MRFVRLTTAQDPRYLTALALYGASFPLHEQRLTASQQSILHEPAYQFRLLYEEEELVGILLCWEADSFLYVEHFAISAEKRSCGCGARALAALERECEAKGKTVILEIDPPEDGISCRRKAFYERNGFCENPYPHIHPPYRPGNEGHRLTVLSCPGTLTQQAYDGFYRYLCDTVMEHCY